MAPHPWLRRPGAPGLLAAVTVAASAATLWLEWASGVGASGFLRENHASSWLAGLVHGLLGAVVWRSRQHPVLAAIFSTAGLLAATSALGTAYADLAAGPNALAGADLVGWLAGWCWLPAILLLWTGVPLVYPQGRTMSRGWTRAAVVAGVAGSIAVLAMASLPVARAWLPPAQVREGVAGAGVAVTAMIGLAATGAIAWRMRRSVEPRRQQEAWFVLSVLISLVASSLPLPAAVGLVGDVLAATALGVGILRYRVVDIEKVLPRALVFVGFTAVVSGTYLAAATALGSSLTGLLWPVVLAAAAAMLLAGGRQRAQRRVEGWVFGARSDPLRALTDLGERLGTALSAEESLPVVVRTVRSSLRVPYAAVVWTDAQAPVEDGRPPARVEHFPLRFGEEELGALVVGLPAGETALGGRDVRLLEAFARQVSVAAHAARVESQLRRSRERLVLAREDERRRIRRDLHDGLGPTLAGIALGLEQVSRSTPAGTAARDVLEELCAETAASVDEVRRIVSGLRPVLLDELGLAEAVRLQTERLSRDALRFGFAVRGEHPGRLPAAVEVAAYRIALEAMTNSLRHAGGTRCEVELELSADAVRLHVSDDGSGPREAAPGHGLTFMRERAEGLGGWCDVTLGAGGGTRVEAVLPAGIR